MLWDISLSLFIISSVWLDNDDDRYVSTSGTECHSAFLETMLGMLFIVYHTQLLLGTRMFANTRVNL